MGLLVSLAFLIVVLVTPAAHADGLLYVDHLAVYDATGRQIGSAWPASDAMWQGHQVDYLVVEFRLSGQPAVVVLQPHWIEPNGFQTSFLYFPNPGCTGVPMVNAEPGAYRMGGLGPFTTESLITAVFGPRSTVYVQSGPVSDRTVVSQRNAQGVCREDPHTLRAAALKATTTHLADHFVPPFTIRTRGSTPVPRRAP
jgi:hypothetical protein